MNRYVYLIFSYCRNFRVAAYRSFFFWIYKKKWTNFGDFRSALPSCVVTKVKKIYPEDDPKNYQGYKPRPLPGEILVGINI